MSSQSLARVETPRTLEEVRSRYSEQNYNLLVPQTSMEMLPAGVIPAVTLVKADMDVKNGGDLYPVEGGNLAPTKTLLNKLAAAGGVTWLDSRRVDDRRHPHYVEWTVTAQMTLPDGSVRRETSSKTIDMREDTGDGRGSDLQRVITTAERARDGQGRDPAREIEQVRMFLQEHAESKAKNRCIRALLGLRTSYSRQQLQRPFAVAKLVPDPQDPFAQRAVVANVLGATRALFGPPPTPEPPIVDASFDESSSAAEGGAPSQTASGDGEVSEAPPLSSGKAEGAARTGPSADLPLFDAEPEYTKDERDRELGRAWKNAQDAGLDKRGFLELIKHVTGKGSYASMGRDDVRDLESEITSMRGGQ